MFSRTLPRTMRGATQRCSSMYERQTSNLTPVSFRIQQRIWPRPRQISTRVAAQRLFKQNPFTFTLAMATILFGGASAIYLVYIYNSYIIGNFHKFPEPVAKKLRRALHYSNIDLDPQKAVDYYKQALAVADEEGMDPFSDEILGVKISLAGFLEKIHQHQRAIDVLEIVRRDCNKWLETVGKREGREGDRTRILAKTVGISVKLGELYANEYIGDQDAAEKNLIAGVEISLRERKRREDEGVKEGEGAWMSNEEMGGALESLANHYEQKDLHYLAAPLYLQCLSLLPQTSCHAVVLMNNLSISLAQQSAPATASTPPPSRSALIANARSWAEKSLSIAAAIKPPERNEECDVGCAVATHNLGEFAEMDGNLAEARKRYEEAKGLSKAIGFSEGAERADEGIKRVRSV